MTAEETNMKNWGAPFTIDGIEVNEGLARFAGREDMYKDALMRFANDRETYHEAEGKDFGRFIHTLKGVAANLGIMKLSELAKATETLFKGGSDYGESFNKTMAELERISVNIRAAVKEPEQAKSKLQFGKKDEYYRLYEELLTALRDFNASESGRIIKKLTETKWIGVSRRDFSGVTSALNAVDFAGALEAAEKLR